jgi:hypothetical protein
MKDEEEEEEPKMNAPWECIWETPGLGGKEAAPSS